MTTQEAGAATVPAPPDDDPPAEDPHRLLDRMHPPMPVGPWTWLGPLLVTIFGGVLRFWHLGRPHAVVFDETYYVKDSWSLLRYGHERAYVDKADELMLGGETELFHERATFIVHPPVGKWIIAAGEKVAGLDPFGWRLGVAIVGTLLIFLTCRVAMRLTRSVLLGCVAGLLLAVDGLAVVMSRTALLDGILAFFLLAAFACLLVDRDDVRLKLAVFGTGRYPLGPRLGWRPWRIAAGVCLGLAVGTKWSALFYIAAFGLMTVLWDSSARRMIGVRHPRWAALRLDAAPGFAALVVVPLVVYVASWSGWLSSGGGWSRQYGRTHDGLPFVPDALRSLWHYHWEIWNFHDNLTQDHPYQSSPWGWLVLARPVAYYSEEGSAGCDGRSCIAEVLGIGTPALWWAACAAAVYMLWRWIGGRDWRAGALLCGLAAGYLPWFLYTDRPIFYFYGIAFLPYLVLAVTLMLGAIIGPVPEPGASVRRRAVGAVAAGTVVALVVMNFFYLYPLLTADFIPRSDWLARMWFRSWI